MLQPVISGLLKNSSSYTDPPNIISRQTFLAIQSMQDTNPYVSTGTKWFQSSTNMGGFTICRKQARGYLFPTSTVDIVSRSLTDFESVLDCTVYLV